MTSFRPTLLELLGKTCFPVYATHKTIKFGPMCSSKKSIASYCSPRYRPDSLVVRASTSGTNIDLLTLVRSTLEYGSVVWDPYIQQDINAIEKVQRQAARFITKDYRSREPGCVTSMLDRLNLPTLQQRREIDRLVYMFKICGRYGTGYKC